MNAILKVLLEVTVYSSVIASILLLLRALFKKKISAKLQYMAWLLLIVRLMVPITVESGVHFFTIKEKPAVVETASQEAPAESRPAVETPAQAAPQTAPMVSQNTAPQAKPQTNPAPAEAAKKPTIQITWQQVVIGLWIMGMVALGVFFIRARVRFMKKLNLTMPTEEKRMEYDRICEEMMLKVAPQLVVCDVQSPALMGNKVLIPENLTGQALRYALYHELTHYRRKDHLMVVLMSALRCVYWFNPLVWVAFSAMQTDMEVACDAGVMESIGAAEKKGYLMTLLKMFSSHTTPAIGMAQAQSKRAAKARIEGAFRKHRTGRAMRMVSAIAACMILICCFTTACQPTPQEDVVVEKDIDEMIEKAIEEKEETAEPLAFPEKYECAFTEFDGRFNVSADVKITAPKNVSSLPTVKTRGRAFAQDEVTRLFRYLFADETAYDVLNQSTVMTKTGIEASIVALERAIAFGYDGEALTEEQVSEHLRQIEALKAEYPSAPDKAEELPVSDGTLSDGSNMGSVGKRLMVRDAAQERSLDIWSSAESDSYIHYTTDRVYAVYDSESSADAADSPEGLIPLSEAVSAAQALLDAMGAENLQKTGVYLADDRQIGLVDGIVKDAENYAYKFVYSSLIEGVPVANMGNTLVSSEYGGSRRYEKIELLIDNEGIAEFVWNAPMEIREVVSTHTNIVDFETAAERFEELMFQSYSPWVASEDAAETGMKMNFNVSAVELSLMRIIDPKAAEATGDIYVPAYLFYGVGTLEQDGQFIGYIETPSVCNLEFTGEKAFVVINAIDGSSINVEEGY